MSPNSGQSIVKFSAAKYDFTFFSLTHSTLLLVSLYSISTNLQEFPF